jgi:CheY-like chemotaxis protein
LITTYPTSKRTILCIADDEAILRYEKALLERSGYAVLTATSAQQGLRLVAMCECDAVLLDYDAPVIDGFEVASQIKRVTPEPPVILLSGQEVPPRMLELVDAYVPKLEASRELLPMIAQLFNQIHYPPQKRESVPKIFDSPPQPSPRGRFDRDPRSARSPQDWEEDS